MPRCWTVIWPARKTSRSRSSPKPSPPTPPVLAPLVALVECEDVVCFVDEVLDHGAADAFEVAGGLDGVGELLMFPLEGYGVVAPLVGGRQ